MTPIEVNEFVEREIAARYKGGLNDTQRGDWIRAVGRAGSIETARQIIRAIVDDPEATLTIKAFCRQLPRSIPVGEARLVWREDCPLEAWLFKVGDPRMRQRLCFATHRVFKDGTLAAIPWTAEQLIEHLSPWVQSRCHGWVLDIRQAKPIDTTPYRGPSPLREAAKIIKQVPPPPPAPRIPTREELEALGTGKPAPARKMPRKFFGQPFDPETDPDLQTNETSRPREPGEDDL